MLWKPRHSSPLQGRRCGRAAGRVNGTEEKAGSGFQRTSAPPIVGPHEAPDVPGRIAGEFFMVRPFLLPLMAALVLPAGAGRAAPATQAEADRLKSLLERYVGQGAPGEPSVLSITPDGASYRISFDVKRALAGLGAYQISLDPAVSVMQVTQRDDGNWTAALDSMPPIVLHMGPQTTAMRYREYHYSGTFDTKAGGFTDGHSLVLGATSDRTGPELEQHQEIERIELTHSGHAEAGGAITIGIKGVMSGLKQTVLMSPPAGPDAARPPAPLLFTYAVPTMDLDLSVDNARQRQLLDLWAFFVAHPDRERIAQAQEELRGLLRAAMPLLDGFREAATLHDLRFGTPVGVMTSRSLGFELALADLPGTGHMTIATSGDGVGITADALPAWAATLVPTTFNLRADLTGFHAAEAMAEAINRFDLPGKGLAPEDIDRILHIARPGPGKVTIAPSRIASGTLDVSAQGEVDLATGMPAVHVVLHGKGFDEAIRALQGAAVQDPAAAEAMRDLVLAKSLGRAGPDGSLEWAVDVVSGVTTINGKPLK